MSAAVTLRDLEGYRTLSGDRGVHVAAGTRARLAGPWKTLPGRPVARDLQHLVVDDVDGAIHIAASAGAFREVAC